jgi:hypothetical protein
VRARLRDVVLPQPAIEADRRVEGLEGRVLGLGEARQAPQLTQRSGRRRSVPPGWRARTRAGRA